MMFNKKGNVLYLIGLFFFFLFIVVLGSAVGIFVSYSPRLPDIDSISKSRPPETTKIYAEDGTLLANLFFVENRTIVPISRVPESLKLAVISIEDAKFYEHRGVDISGIVRAIYKNIRGQRIIEGGSTITQQLAKNLFLTHERTIFRKIKEILISFQIERKYSKDEILELYLNQIYFGEGAYGVESAAQTYFGRSVDKINLSEAALLAGLPKSPVNYSPYVNREVAKQRQDMVLGRMLEVGFITDEEYIAAKKYPLQLAPKQNRGEENYVAPYFTSYVISQLIEEFSADTVFRGGLRVYTTLNMKMQKTAEKVMSDALLEAEKNKLKITQGALVAMDPRTGYVLSLVGGRDYLSSKFNRATQAKRQPGSAFKPFVYTAAIEQGFTPNSIVEDAPVEYRTGSIKPWRPQNYDMKFRGIMTFRRALALSVNIPAVKVAEQVGIDTVIDYASKMGITTISARQDRNLALALGGLTFGVTPLDMTVAFSTLANEGVKCKPLSILKVEHSNGVILKENKIDREVVLSKKTAWTITDMLRDVVKYGTGTAANIGRDVAGKTGTTSDFRDCWFVGFTPMLSVTVWFGNDDNTPTNKVVGGQLPARIWAKFTRQALAGTPVVNFPFSRGDIFFEGVKKDIDVPPDEITEDNLVEVQVCKQSNLIANNYCPEIIIKKFSEEEKPTEVCNLHSSSPSFSLTKPSSSVVDVDICRTSGKLANEYCPEIIVKEYPIDKVPRAVCDIHTQKNGE